MATRRLSGTGLDPVEEGRQGRQDEGARERLRVLEPHALEGVGEEAGRRGEGRQGQEGKRLDVHRSEKILQRLSRELKAK